VSQIASLFQQMLTGIAHLHSKNLVHRDVKFENVLLDGVDLESVKLCDFGFATLVPYGKDLKGIIGTAPYMSPEMLTQTYNTKTDIWSMGVRCFFFLSGGRLPYEPEESSSFTMKKAISEGSQIKHFDASKNVTIDAKHLTITLLNRKATSRVTAVEALQHSFLQSAESKGMSRSPSEQSTIASEQDCQDCDIPEDGIIESPVTNMIAKRPAATCVASNGCFDKAPTEERVLFKL
jgi:serine/threonine protein kinase